MANRTNSHKSGERERQRKNAGSSRGRTKRHSTGTHGDTKADAQECLLRLGFACNLYHDLLIAALKLPSQPPMQRRRQHAGFAIEQKDLMALEIKTLRDLCRTGWGQILELITLQEAKQPHRIGSITPDRIVFTPSDDHQQPNEVSAITRFKSVSTFGKAPRTESITFHQSAIVMRVQFIRSRDCLPWWFVCRALEVAFNHAEPYLHQHNSALRHVPLLGRIKSTNELVKWRSRMSRGSAEGDVNSHRLECYEEIERVLRFISWGNEVKTGCKTTGLPRADRPHAKRRGRRPFVNTSMSIEEEDELNRDWSDRQQGMTMEKFAESKELKRVICAAAIRHSQQRSYKRPPG